MLTKYLRLFKHSGVFNASTNPLVDISLNDGITVNFDTLYIAQHYPFVNLFLLMDVLNTQTTKLKIEYWINNEWKQAVDVLDATEGLKKTGMLQFSTRNHYLWHEITETDDDSQSCPTEFKGLYVNNCYWLKISFITTGGYAVPDATTKIKKIGYAFTTTDYINSIDIEAPNYYESILAGKTNWVNEIMHASEEMIHDLKRIGFIKSAGEIIEFDELYLACAWKTLSHIYFQLGKGYADNRELMNDKYEKALGSKALSFDNNRDGKLDRRELNATSTRMSR
jgi:hypothetical protein